MNLTEKVIREQFSFWKEAQEVQLPQVTQSKVVITGCGTSYYLAQSIAAAFNLHGRDAIAVPGAEWTSRMKAYVADPSNCLVIGLSRSGTTSETVAALRASRTAGLKTLAISCGENTPIFVEAESAIYLPTHAEEGIVMTSSASLMLIAGLRLALSDVSEAAAAEAAMTAVENCGSVLEGRSHFVFLGGGELFGVATEGSLKGQEMSISFTQAYHPLEYRHGPVSLIDEGSVVVMLYSDQIEAEKLLVVELQQKGAKVIGLGGPGDLEIPMMTQGAARCIEVLPALQMIGERMANAKDLDTAAPRHLTKVVVLESA
jgi:glucosamine--fructose-6-phosphate aminotransferase (isomerizing)